MTRRVIAQADACAPSTPAGRQGIVTTEAMTCARQGDPRRVDASARTDPALVPGHAGPQANDDAPHAVGPVRTSLHTDRHSARDGPSRDPIDSDRVELNETSELQYWTGRFGCTADQLIVALVAVGVNASAVGQYLAAILA